MDSYDHAGGNMLYLGTQICGQQLFRSVIFGYVFEGFPKLGPKAESLLQVYSPYNVISGTTQTSCYIESYVM